MPQIRTPRLALFPGTPSLLRAELESPETLARELAAVVPASWPPELYDGDAIRYMLDWLEANPAQSAWSFYYVLKHERAGAADASESRPVLIGAGGYKGAPDATGTVEIGYSIVPEYRRQGYAREAVDGWLAHAFADARVTRVIAHTLTELEPSIAVLRSAAFDFAGSGSDPTEPTAVQYVLTRESYEATSVDRHPARHQ